MGCDAMNGEQHAAISEMLIETAEVLARNPRTGLAAGELVWGAAFHACGAADRHPDAQHRQLRTRRELTQVIDRLLVNRQTRRYLLDGLNTVQRRLHNHFYAGQLSDNELAEHIEIGIAFSKRLLQIAKQL